MSTRLSKGGRLIDRTAPQEFTFNGKRMRGYRGDSAASKALTAAAALHRWLTSPASPVLHNRAEGKFQDKAHGISIYVPASMPSPVYKSLDFNSSGWLNALNKVFQA